MRRSEYRDIENQKYPQRAKTPRPTVLGAPHRIASAAMPESALHQSAGSWPVGLVRYAARVRSRERWSS